MKGVEEEFAIETAAEQYINRRQFSKFLVLTSLGMFVGNLWILVKSWLRRSPAYPARVIAGVNEIAVGDVKLFSYPEPADGCIMKSTAVWPFGSARSFGSPGAGGSIGFADPDTGIGYAYVTSQMGTALTGDPRDVALRDALNQALRVS